MLNPYFIQGNSSEQRLIQDLINEQLKMYGINIGYIPRGFYVENEIIRENILGSFSENYYMEAYVASYGGFGGSGDILSKFGVKSNDELTLIISREIFEDFISPFLETVFEDKKYKITNRPKEGDLIYFPLTDTVYEIKFVEHETEFYQLGKLYIYELRCEPFMFEDEDIITGIEEIDDNFSDRGMDAVITVTGYGVTATASTTVVNGGVNGIYLINDGYGYISPPTVSISSAPSGGINATAVATITRRSFTGLTTSYAIDKIYITNPGAGYTTPPTVTFVGGGGYGAIATTGIGNSVIGRITISNGGTNYNTAPNITITPAPTGGITATAEALVNSSGIVTGIYITNAGLGYTTVPSIVFPVATAGVGTYTTYLLNESIIGTASSTTALVKTWDASTLKLHVYRLDGRFNIGEVVRGISGGARYFIKSVDYFNDEDNYAQNKEIETEADLILDFTESNPFGEY